jgi:hypothetical protein
MGAAPQREGFAPTRAASFHEAPARRPDADGAPLFRAAGVLVCTQVAENDTADSAGHNWHTFS